MAQYTYTVVELGTKDIGSLIRRGLAAGYTEIYVTPLFVNDDYTEIDIEVAEDPTRETLLTNLTTPEPTLTATPSMISCQATDQVEVTITGPVGAVVKASWYGLLPMSAREWTLDGNGEATFQIGPFIDGWCTSDPNAVRLLPLDPSVAPAVVGVTVG